MAYCPQCKAEMALQAAKCPHCGYEYPPLAPLSHVLPLKWRRLTVWSLAAGLVALVVVFAVAAAMVRGYQQEAAAEQEIIEQITAAGGDVARSERDTPWFFRAPAYRFVDRSALERAYSVTAPACRSRSELVTDDSEMRWRRCTTSGAAASPATLPPALAAYLLESGTHPRVRAAAAAQARQAAVAVAAGRRASTAPAAAIDTAALTRRTPRRGARWAAAARGDRRTASRRRSRRSTRARTRRRPIDRPQPLGMPVPGSRPARAARPGRRSWTCSRARG